MNSPIAKISKPQSTTGLVFIAGAGLGSWIWQDMISTLNIPSLAISFPDAQLKKHMHLGDYVKAASKQIDSWQGISTYIIVGHSIGAIVALELAEALQNKVAGVVAIGSVVPKQGQSFFGALPFPQNLLMPLITKLVGTRPPENAIKKSYCNDLSDAQATEIVKRFQPESYFLYADALAASLPDVPRLYIATLKDQTTPHHLQKLMADNFKATKIDSIDAGHLPMLSQPAKLSNLLYDFATSK